MPKTVAKTYRLPEGLHHSLATTAERLQTSEADVVRLAVRHYFQDTQKSNELSLMEARLFAKIESGHNSLTHQITQILALAQPAGGQHG